MDFAPPFDRRSAALGDFRVLPDETLCTLLDLLAPPDLARLACVSSAFYILCNEEPLWMSQCLRIGGLVEYKDTWKKTTLIRQNLCSESEQLPHKRLQFDGLNSLFLYRRWYRCFTNLSAFSLDNGVIERRESLTLEEFHSDFDCKKPVLLTELANDWPARTKWTIDQLSLDYGDVPFRISQRSSKKITMKFKDYASYMKVQHDEDPLYIFDDKFAEAAPTLLDDYNVPDLFKEDYFDVLESDKRPPFRWLIIGPERSGASWHVDPALTSAWNTLLVGRKRWALYPPGRVPAGVTVHVNEEDGDVNIESPTSLQWWLDVYPMLAEHDKPIECTQLPGETIFVPSGWWHCVLNLETTVAVTQNFVNASNFEFVCLDMTPGHRHKGVCRAGLLAVHDDSCMDVDSGECFQKKNDPHLTHQAKKLKVSEHGKEAFKYNNSIHTSNVVLKAQTEFDNGRFSYDMKFLSSFLEKDRDHYNSVWSSGNCIGQREFREWLHKLWISKVGMRELIWKGALLALNVDKWYSCMVEICRRHNLPSPLDDEKLPVGTGSNPVYLISDYVIKIYAEDGLANSIYGLGTELEFYHLLHNAKSPLMHHIPDVLASGIIVKDGGSVQLFPWDGKGVPDVISHHNFVAGDGNDKSFYFGVWGKKTFQLNDQEVDSSTNIWPYIVIKRCKGELFANLREFISNDDVLHLASFLGDQLRNLHLLPLPKFESRNLFHVEKNSLERVNGDTAESCMHSELIFSAQTMYEDLNIPPEWELVIEALNKKRKNIKQRLSMWGDPIPNHLIDKVEEYIPVNLAMLLDLYKDNDGSYKVSRVPSWIHSDIMDDNILMEPCQPADHIKFPSADCTSSGKLESDGMEERVRRWKASHIIDFSDLTLGDPLYDFIPVYLDVFRGDSDLLMEMLRSYGLPLTRTSVLDALSFQSVENDENLKKLSYRAMCYCILYDENVLGAIFSLWKELRTATSWEEVESTVWGKLNAYQHES